MKQTLLAAIVVALATGWLYSRELASAPVYLQHDEVHFALQSASVATTGRDQMGNRLPLYFDLLSWSSLGNRSDVYWQAFNPSRLFFSGESSLNESTRTAGTFPLAFLLLLPIGLITLIRRPISAPHLLVVVGMLTAPLPAVLVLDGEVRRYLVIAIFAAFIATAGVARLWSIGGIAARSIAILAVASVPWFFQSFYQDYLGDWRVNSSGYFGGNIRGAVDVVLASPRADTPSHVLLSSQVPYLDVYWELYRRMRHRDDLAGRARGLAFAEGHAVEAPPRSVAVLAATEPAVPVLTAAGWRTIATVPEFYGGSPSFVVLSNEVR